MAVESKDGFGFSTHAGFGRMYMSDGIFTYGGEDGKSFVSPPNMPDMTSNSEWSFWGDNNLLPLEMANHIENCPALCGALDMKARIAIGKGLSPFLSTGFDAEGKEMLQPVDDDEINQWIDYNELYETALDLSYDRNAYGWNCGTYILNKNRDKINRIRRIDAATVRLQKKNSAGDIENIYLSEYWDRVTSSIFDSNTIAKIPLLNCNNELKDLNKKMRTTGGVEFAFANRRLRNGRGYYPLPGWWSARLWVKVARSVPAFKNAMFANSITVKYIISISEQYWKSVYQDTWEGMGEQEQKRIREEKWAEIDKYLTGVEKAHKSISSGSWYDPKSGAENSFIKIEVLDDKVKDGKLLPDSSAANQEILYSVQLNTATTGAGQSQGPYSQNTGGSNIREGYSQQLMILEAERKEIIHQMNLVSEFNGWSKRLNNNGKRLVFRYPSGMLTTLDTGKSTKTENV